jgi:hypothetical protein
VALSCHGLEPWVLREWLAQAQRGLSFVQRKEQKRNEKVAKTAAGNPYFCAYPGARWPRIAGVRNRAKRISRRGFARGAPILAGRSRSPAGNPFRSPRPRRKSPESLTHTESKDITHHSRRQLPPCRSQIRPRPYFITEQRTAHKTEKNFTSVKKFSLR